MKKLILFVSGFLLSASLFASAGIVKYSAKKTEQGAKKAASASVKVLKFGKKVLY